MQGGSRLSEREQARGLRGERGSGDAGEGDSERERARGLRGNSTHLGDL